MNSNSLRIPLELPGGDSIRLTGGRAQQHQRRASLRFSEDADLQALAPLIDVELYDAEIGQYRYGGMSLADLLNGLQRRSPASHARVLEALDRHRNELALLAEHVTTTALEDQLLVLPKPPYLSALVSHLCTVGPSVGSVAQWRGILASAPSRGVNSKEIAASGVVDRLAALADRQRLARKEVLARVGLSHVVPRLVSEVRVGVLTTAGRKTVRDREKPPSSLRPSRRRTTDSTSRARALAPPLPGAQWQRRADAGDAEETNAIARARRSRIVAMDPPACATFIGIDLAWKVDGNHSGIVVLEGRRDTVHLSAVSSGCTSLDDVVQWSSAHLRETTVIAVDSSLVVTNSSGQRPCETAISRTFGRYHASCHSTNLAMPHASLGARLVRELSKHDVVHDFDIRRAAGRAGRWLFEVYPHPSMIRLFGLDTILSYKKGKVDQKRRGLRELQNHLRALIARRAGLSRNDSLDELLSTDVDDLRGQALKRYEDTLDALLCAYLAWHCWRWGPERNRMYGSLQDGYIVVGGEKHDGVAA